MASKEADGGLPPLPRWETYIALRVESMKIGGMNKEHGAKRSAIHVALGTAIVFIS